jgi:hypothetical protein
MTATERDDDRTYRATGHTANWADSAVLDALFGVLADRDNRQLLAYLVGLDGRIASVSELVDHVVDARGDDARASAVRSAVHHDNLARLDEAGLVNFDPDRGVVEYLAPTWFEVALAAHRELLFADAEDPAAVDAEDPAAVDAGDTGCAAETATADDVAADLLAAPRRRHAVEILARWDEPVTLADLAEAVAEAESDRPFAEIPAETVLDVYLSLYCDHVPLLEDAGYVNYDQECDAVWPDAGSASFDSVC